MHHNVFRTRPHEIEIAGVQLGKHEKALPLIGSAIAMKRGGAAYQFDITRRVRGHIVFVTGIHDSIGQMVA